MRIPVEVRLTLLNWNIWPLTWGENYHRTIHLGPLFIRYRSQWFGGWRPE